MIQLVNLKTHYVMHDIIEQKTVQEKDRLFF